MRKATYPDSIPFGIKLAYGLGDLGPAIVASVQGFFLQAFLLDVAGIPAGAAAVIFLLSRLWDAVNDPLIGTLSDRTQSKMGRRKPWIVFGAVPFGLAFFLLWVVPPFEGGLRIAYYTLILILLDTAFTAVNTPYAALTAELTDDYDERTALNAYRFSFSILGGVAAAFIHSSVIIPGIANVLTAHLVSAGIWAFFIISSLLTMAAIVPEQPALDPETLADDQPGFIEGLRIALSNRAFILVSLIFMLSWSGLQFVQNNLQLYWRYWIGADEGLFGVVLLVLQVLAFVWVLVWSRVSKRIGKKRTYYIGISFWIVAGLGIFFIPQGAIVPVFIAIGLASVGLGAAYLIPWSMLPDVIELDELQTGQRREGVFYGVFAFLQKTAVGVAIATSNAVLGLAGYINAVPGQPLPTQNASTLVALRLFVGPLAALLLIGGMVAVYLFPITQESHAQVVAELERRRTAE